MLNQAKTVDNFSGYFPGFQNTDFEQWNSADEDNIGPGYVDYLEVLEQALRQTFRELLVAL